MIIMYHCNDATCHLSVLLVGAEICGDGESSANKMSAREMRGKTICSLSLPLRVRLVLSLSLSLV